MDIISVVLILICVMVIFSCGFFWGYKVGMATMKRIDDIIITEAKRVYTKEEREE